LSISRPPAIVHINDVSNQSHCGSKLNLMDLTKRLGLSIRGKSPWPNMFIFPKELRDTIPHYGARALVFDCVYGSTNNFPAKLSGLVGEIPFDLGPRAQLQFIVHETGKLDGKFALWMDLDSMTTRALGQFLVDLANRTEAQES